MNNANGLVSTAERILLIGGIALLGCYLIATLYGEVLYQLSLREFDRNLSRPPAAGGMQADNSKRDEPAKLSAGHQSRIGAPRASGSAVVAVLRLVKLNLRIPVFEGTSPTLLNQGAGWIVGTARPGETGNVGIAGHRDRFFRGLKDFDSGDVIELSTKLGKLTYIVDQKEIVGPKDVGVLAQRGAPSLTLVTCYPFHFVGSASQRFVLHATLVSQPAVEHGTVRSGRERNVKSKGEST